MTTIEITITEDASAAADEPCAWADAYSKLSASLTRTAKQRDALVVERDAILFERDDAYRRYNELTLDAANYLAERDTARSECADWKTAADNACDRWYEQAQAATAHERAAREAEASMLKASTEVGRLDQELAKLIADDARLRYLLKQADDNNVKLAERNVNLRYELEASEAKRLELLASLDGKDELLNDFSKENLRLAEVIKMKDDLDDRRQQELANVRQQLTELKLKHNQPAAFPWNLYGPNGFFFNSHAASITSKAAAEPATSKTEVKS